MPNSIAACLLASSIIFSAIPVAVQGAQPDNEQKKYTTRPGPKTSLFDTEVKELRNAWENARNPRILVSVGVANDRSVDFSNKSEAVSRLEKSIVGELTRAFPGAVVDLESSRQNNDRVLDALRYNMGEEASPDLDKILRQKFDADVRLEVTLRQRGRSLLTEGYSVRDLQEGAFMGMGTLNRNGDVTQMGADKFLATVICEDFSADFIPWSQQTIRTYSIVAMSKASSDSRFERDLRYFERSIEKELKPNVKWAESSSEERDGVLYTTFDVRFDGKLEDLLFDIENDVLEEAKLGWNIVYRTPKDVGVFLYKADRPMWHLLTDADSDVAKEAQRKRIPKLSGARLGIVIGSDINDPEGYFSNTGEKALGSIDALSLRASLVNQFTDLGFRVQADDSIRRRLNELQNNVERYDNAPHMLEALGDLSEVDYLLHVNMSESDEGQERLIARLYSPEEALEISQQVWPSPVATRLSAYSVDPNRDDEVARFIAGQLLNRMDRHLMKDENTSVVRVLNAPNAQAVLHLTDIFKEAVRGVRSVEDLQISTPAASFEVVHTGEITELTLQAIDRIGTSYPGTEVQLLHGTMVLNMNPVVLDEETLAAVRARQIALEPDDSVTEPAPPAPRAIASEQDRLTQALRDVRDSVWLIYIQTQDRAWTGTGWTVGENLIATNAHVVDDVPERLARGEEVIAVAVSDSGLTRRLVLGRAHRHPRWTMDETKPDFFYDVGLFEVTNGNPGNPIPLASSEDLKELVAPVIAGYVGFPGQGVWKVNGELPNKQAFIGQINAIVQTNLVENSIDGAGDQMVMHNIMASKGASGSPILGPNGRVIALLNAGQRFGNAAGLSETGDVEVTPIWSGFNAGVRVDILTRYIESLGFKID